MKISSFPDETKRRNYLEKELHISLHSVGSSLSAENGEFHCENLIGGTVIPLGVAGPLIIKKNPITREIFVPLATTEGALVASVQRGCKAIAENGGVKVATKKNGTTRGPVFLIRDLEQGAEFESWLLKEKNTLNSIAKTTSQHISLLRFDTKIAGPYFFIRFYFDTEDAMGMNMVTIATQKIVAYIEEKIHISCLSTAGNFDIDKKPAWLNSISERGISVHAEIVLSKKTLKEVLKTTAQDVYDVWIGKCMIGSGLSGSIGFNAHYANIVAAFFAATGQDLAHVVEGSLGMTVAQMKKNGSLFFSVYLPSLMLGLVGGGTKMKVKKEAISLTESKNVEELGEVLGGAVLAGELSLLASLGEGTLAKAHAALGR